MVLDISQGRGASLDCVSWRTRPTLGLCPTEHRACFMCENTSHAHRLNGSLRCRHGCGHRVEERLRQPVVFVLVGLTEHRELEVLAIGAAVPDVRLPAPHARSPVSRFLTCLLSTCSRQVPTTVLNGRAIGLRRSPAASGRLATCTASSRGSCSLGCARCSDATRPAGEHDAGEQRPEQEQQERRPLRGVEEHAVGEKQRGRHRGQPAERASGDHLS